MHLSERGASGADAPAADGSDEEEDEEAPPAAAVLVDSMNHQKQHVFDLMKSYLHLEHAERTSGGGAPAPSDLPTLAAAGDDLALLLSARQAKAADAEATRAAVHSELSGKMDVGVRVNTALATALGVDMRTGDDEDGDAMASASSALSSPVITGFKRRRDEVEPPDEQSDEQGIFAALEERRIRVPLQHNGIDCGLYMLKYMERIATHMPELSTIRDISTCPELTFSAEEINEFRMKMYYEICEEASKRAV